MTTMRERFDSIDWNEVLRWKAEQELETHHLEFKVKKDPQSPLVADEDKENIAKALSGLANVSGGILILGVSTTSIKGGPDRVSNISSVANADDFMGRVERLVPDLLEPALAGILVRAVADPANGRGIVAILVPESLGGPHRAMNASAKVNDRYYMRTATSSVPMPHSTLGDRFGRAARPKLQLVAEFTSISAGLAVELRLRNVGRGAALRPALQLTKSSSIYDWTRDAARRPDFVGRPHSPSDVEESILYESHDGQIIYPGADRVVAYLQEMNPPRNYEWKPPRLLLQGVIYALDIQPVTFAGTLEASHNKGQRLVLPEGG